MSKVHLGLKEKSWQLIFLAYVPINIDENDTNELVTFKNQYPHLQKIYDVGNFDSRKFGKIKFICLGNFK